MNRVWVNEPRRRLARRGWFSLPGWFADYWTRLALARGLHARMAIARPGTLSLARGGHEGGGEQLLDEWRGTDTRVVVSISYQFLKARKILHPRFVIICQIVLSQRASLACRHFYCGILFIRIIFEISDCGIMVEFEILFTIIAFENPQHNYDWLKTTTPDFYKRFWIHDSCSTCIRLQSVRN